MTSGCPNAENTYQFQSHYRSKQTGEENHFQMTSYVAGQRLERDFPQVERERLRAVQRAASSSADGEALPTEDVLLVDDLFFDVLRFPLVQGNPMTALSRPGTVVLTQSEARRLFGARGRRRPDPDHGLARQSRPTIWSPASPATCRATATSASASSPGSTFRPSSGRRRTS